MRMAPRGDGRSGAVVDYHGFIYHDHTFTHIDALCHIWNEAASGKVAGSTR